MSSIVLRKRRVTRNRYKHRGPRSLETRRGVNYYKFLSGLVTGGVTVRKKPGTITRGPGFDAQLL